MPVHQLIEQSENIAKRRFFSFVSFRSGLIGVQAKKMIISIVKDSI